MKKEEIAALVLTIVGIYGYSTGKTGMTTDAIVQTWGPLAVAGYIFFM